MRRGGVGSRSGSHQLSRQKRATDGGQQSLTLRIILSNRLSQLARLSQQSLQGRQGTSRRGAHPWALRCSLTAVEPSDRYDFLHAFFENAFHLRDWLKDTGAVSEQDLDAFFATNAEMRLCRDLANAHKHYSLKRPGQPAPPSEVREYLPGMGNLDLDVSLVILSDGVKYDAFDLARRILRLWEVFITTHHPL